MTENPPTLAPPASRQRTLVWALIALNLCVYGVLAFFFFSPRARPEPITPVIESDPQLTLQQAHDQAISLALQWQADAQLVGVSTSWQLAGGDRLTLYRPTWSFSFFSPAQQQMQWIVVDRQSSYVVRTWAARAADLPVKADWSMDSNDLLLTFLAAGGDDFLKSHSLVNIHMHLQQDPNQDQNRSIWSITALDPQKQQSFTLHIDAISRAILQD